MNCNFYASQTETPDILVWRSSAVVRIKRKNYFPGVWPARIPVAPTRWEWVRETIVLRSRTSTWAWERFGCLVDLHGSGRGPRPWALMCFPCLVARLHLNTCRPLAPHRDRVLSMYRLVLSRALLVWRRDLPPFNQPRSITHTSFQLYPLVFLALTATLWVKYATKGRSMSQFCSLTC